VVWEFVETPNSLPVLWSSNGSFTGKKTSSGNVTSGGGGTSNHNGLSTGQRVGIGIGATVGLVLAVLLAWLLFKRSNRHTQPSYSPEAPQERPDLFSTATNTTTLSEIGPGKLNRGLGRAELEVSEKSGAKFGKPSQNVQYESQPGN
jgi:hypothetical protein